MDSYFANMIQSSLDSAHTNKAVQASRALVNSDAKDTKQAAKDFEAMFVAQMLRPMFETIPENDLFGGGRAEEMWRDVLTEEYGKVVVDRGGLGIADYVMKEMLKLQEVADKQKTGAIL